MVPVQLKATVGQAVCRPHALIESTVAVHTSLFEKPESKHDHHMTEVELPVSSTNVFSLFHLETVVSVILDL